MMALCIHCVDNYGEMGVEMMDLMLEGKEEIAEHLENYHHAHVSKRPWETRKEAITRCQRKGLFLDKRKCKCEECRDRRWIRSQQR